MSKSTNDLLIEGLVGLIKTIQEADEPKATKPEAVTPKPKAPTPKPKAAPKPKESIPNVSQELLGRLPKVEARANNKEEWEALNGGFATAWRSFCFDFRDGRMPVAEFSFVSAELVKMAKQYRIGLRWMA